MKFITGRATFKEEGEHCITRQEFKNVIAKLDAYGKTDENLQYSTYFRPRFASDDDCDKAVRDYVKKMLGRIVFLHFLQHKGWLCNDRNFMQHLFEQSAHKDDFLDRVLEPLFFAVLNTKPEERINVCHRHNKKVGTDPNIIQWDEQLLQQWNDIPYLNGGLFEQEAIDVCRSIFPKEYFADLIDFFGQYNFTIDENDPDDAEVGVDPEMLSKIFESLLEDNKDKGAYYTPKEIVRYMCQESLIAYLVTHQPELKDDIEQLVRHNMLTDKLQGDTSKAIALNDLLKNVKICDPAIGSGAFPMGLLNLIFACRRTLHELTDMVSDNTNEQIKSGIIQNNIYGVDIEQGAVDIARLRFWLALVVDAKEPRPLPNLDYKIMKGNSLLSTFNGEYIDLSGKTKKENHIRHDETAIAADKIHLANMQREYFCLNGEEKYTAEIAIKNLILDIIEKQLGYDRKVFLNKNNIQLSLWNSSSKPTTIELPESIANSVVTLEELRSHLNNETLSLHERAATNLQFFDWEIMYANVFDNGGVDIVIANPPYVQVKTKDKWQYMDFPAIEGRIDLFEIFIQKGMCLLMPKGTLTFINPNTVLSNLYSMKLRKLMISQYGLCEITNFGMDVFDTPIVHTCILRMKKGILCNEIGIKKSVNSISEIFKPFDYYLSIKDVEKTKNYTFDITMNKDEISLFNKLNTHTPLGEMCFLRQCIKTGNDKEYVMYSDTPLPKPWEKGLRGKSIGKYCIKEDNLYIKYGNWLARNWANETFYKRHKIAIREAGKTITACLDDNNRYFLSSLYAIYPKQEYTESTLLGLLALLNSKLATFYVTKVAFDLTQGAFTKMRTNQLARLPICENVVNDCHILKLISSILTKKNLNSDADTSKEECEIDRLVYKLYGLTYDEVKIVDPKTDITEEEYNK